MKDEPEKTTRQQTLKINKKSSNVISYLLCDLRIVLCIDASIQEIAAQKIGWN